MRSGAEYPGPPISRNFTREGAAVSCGYSQGSRPPWALTHFSTAKRRSVPRRGRRWVAGRAAGGVPGGGRGARKGGGAACRGQNGRDQGKNGAKAGARGGKTGQKAGFRRTPGRVWRRSRGKKPGGSREKEPGRRGFAGNGGVFRREKAGGRPRGGAVRGKKGRKKPLLGAAAGQKRRKKQFFGAGRDGFAVSLRAAKTGFTGRRVFARIRKELARRCRSHKIFGRRSCT